MEREESKNKGAAYQGGEVEWSRLLRDVLRKRLDCLHESETVKERIAAAAYQIIKHREGTRFEDLAYIDSIDGKMRINKGFDFYDEEKGVSACKPSESMDRMLEKAAANEIIGLHNHTMNSVPSRNDFEAALQRNYKYGIVVCHDGVIYKYRVNGKFSWNDVKPQLAKLRNAIYNENEERLSSAIRNLSGVGVEMEVIP